MSIAQTLEGVLLSGDVEYTSLYSRADCFECGGHCIHDELQRHNYNRQIRDAELRRQYVFDEVTIQDRIDATYKEEPHLNVDIVGMPKKISDDIIGYDQHKRKLFDKE